jgi:outer membrane receptor protein involved in Fe transport
VSTTSTVYLGAQESYDIFDLAVSWSATERTTVRMGVDNVFDVDPVPTAGRSAADPNPTTGMGTTEAGFYDVLGRQLYIGVSAAF